MKFWKESDGGEIIATIIFFIGLVFILPQLVICLIRVFNFIDSHSVHNHQILFRINEVEQVRYERDSLFNARLLHIENLYDSLCQTEPSKE